jgi:arsenate reductase-like glutaredoxin family protein|tara:strand:- start:811 stop:1059 length:249 start_codon:yes stop_codon:yes gene_type:complete
MKTKQIWNYKERTFTRDDLQTIIEYLERRQAFLRSEINFHEADDRAATKGLLDHIYNLKSEKFALENTINTAVDQLEQVDAA